MHPSSLHSAPIRISADPFPLGHPLLDIRLYPVHIHRSCQITYALHADFPSTPGVTRRRDPPSTRGSIHVFSPPRPAPCLFSPARTLALEAAQANCLRGGSQKSPRLPDRARPESPDPQMPSNSTRLPPSLPLFSPSRVPDPAPRPLYSAPLHPVFCLYLPPAAPGTPS